MCEKSGSDDVEYFNNRITQFPFASLFNYFKYVEASGKIGGLTETTTRLFSAYHFHYDQELLILSFSLIRILRWSVHYLRFRRIFYTLKQDSPCKSSYSDTENIFGTKESLISKYIFMS